MLPVYYDFVHMVLCVCVVWSFRVRVWSAYITKLGNSKAWWFYNIRQDGFHYMFYYHKYVLVYIDCIFVCEFVCLNKQTCVCYGASFCATF